MMKRILLGGLLLMFVAASPALAGKNSGGSMIVHTNDAVTATNNFCTTNYDDPGSCEAAGTSSYRDGEMGEASIVWFLAAFDATAEPGVTVCYFGVDHNLPDGYITPWDYCGPSGTLEAPDAGWPAATAGNSVAFGSALTTQLFPFYWFSCFSHASDSYFGTGINPTGGYAAFISNDNPAVADNTTRFGIVSWFDEEGYNTCPLPPTKGACCLPNATCLLLFEGECEGTTNNGVYQGDNTACETTACGACCYWQMTPEVQRKCVVTGQVDCEEGSWANGVIDVAIIGPVGSDWSGPGNECTGNQNEADQYWFCEDPRIDPPNATEVSSWGKLKSSYR